MRILVVEDEVAIAAFVDVALAIDGYEVEHEASATGALKRLRDGGFDMAILDLGLPDQDGLWLLQHMRDEGVRVPVVVLSGRAEATDVESALDAGADLYMVKPIAARALRARIRAFTRRLQHQQNTYTVDGVVLDADNRTLQGERGRVDLTNKEFTLLREFFAGPKNLHPHAELLQRVWGFTFDPGTSVLDVAIHRLRLTLRKATLRIGIRSQRGSGFSLITVNEGEPEIEMQSGA